MRPAWAEGRAASSCPPESEPAHDRTVTSSTSPTKRKWSGGNPNSLTPSRINTSTVAGRATVEAVSGAADGERLKILRSSEAISVESSSLTDSLFQARR